MIDRPVIIVAAPRSGTTLLHRCLAVHEDLWHLRAESHHIIEGPFRPDLRNGGSNKLTADDAAPHHLELVRTRFADAAVNYGNLRLPAHRILASDGAPGAAASRLAYAAARLERVVRRPQRIRLVEKTPKNSLRVSFLDAVFPDARFVYLVREPIGNIRSLLRAWRLTGGHRFGQGRFARHGYPVMSQLDIADYAGSWWKFALVPEWRSLKGKLLADVCAWQYYQCNRVAQQDLLAIDPVRVKSIGYEDFVRDPVATMRAVLDFADLRPSAKVDRFARELPRVNAVAPSRGPDTEGHLRVEVTRALDDLGADLRGVVEGAERFSS